MYVCLCVYTYVYVCIDQMCTAMPVSKCINVLSAYMSVCTMYVLGACRSRTSDSLELWLEMVASHHVDDGN